MVPNRPGSLSRRGADEIYDRPPQSHCQTFASILVNLSFGFVSDRSLIGSGFASARRAAPG